MGSKNLAACRWQEWKDTHPFLPYLCSDSESPRNSQLEIALAITCYWTETQNNPCSLPANITEILWSLSVEAKWELFPHTYFLRRISVLPSSRRLHIEFGQSLVCYQLMKDRLERCHLVGVTPKKTPLAKAEQAISLKNKQEERRMAFHMSKGRDRSETQVHDCSSVQLHSKHKRVFFGNTCRRINSFSLIPFFDQSQRSAYLCYGKHWGKLCICSRISGTVLKVWYCFSWIVRRNWRDKDEFRKETADGLLAARHLLSSTQKYPHLICVQGHPTNIHLNSGLLSHFSSPFSPLSRSTLKDMKHFYQIICHVIKTVLTSIFKNGKLTEYLPN